MKEITFKGKNTIENDSSEPLNFHAKKDSRRRFIVDKLVKMPIGLVAPIAATNILTPFLKRPAVGNTGNQFSHELVDSLTKVHECYSNEYRYATTDNEGHNMDCLKVLFIKDYGYIGVYHFDQDPVSPSNIFNLALATSKDLINWTFETLLIPYNPTIPLSGSHATMPDLVQLPNGAFLLAYEKDNNRQIKEPFTWIELRYYKDLHSLLTADAQYSRKIPHTLSNSAEGTPNIDVVNMQNDIEKSLIRISFHYNNHMDEQGVGLLKNFKEWTSISETKVNTLFRSKGIYGGIGGRNFIDNIRLQEAQRVPYKWEEFRPYLVDQGLFNFLQLNLETHKGSIASGNHKSSILPGPSGKKVRFNSYFIFDQGSKPGEKGQLIFFKEIQKERSRLF